VANLSVLFDVFPEEVGARKLQPSSVSAPVHGLIQDFVVDYSEDQQSVIWSRFPHHGHATELPDAEELSDLPAGLPNTISCAAAVLATRRSGPDLKPVITTLARS
jgi:DNA phosphorothioation-dependent restriction protein DptH